MMGHFLNAAFVDAHFAQMHGYANFFKEAIKLLDAHTAQFRHRRPALVGKNACRVGTFEGAQRVQIVVLGKQIARAVSPIVENMGVGAAETWGLGALWVLYFLEENPFSCGRLPKTIDL